MQPLLAVVLAAGKGTRMKSALPKVLHPIAGLSMLGHVLGAARAAGSGITAVVIGPGMENVAREARIMTDEHTGYRFLKDHFASHGTTAHSRGEYVNLEDRTIHSNTVEGYFSIFKRGMKGIYQHCGEQHLHRYLAEFEFRYNNRAALGCNDTDRSVAALSGIVGKRLTYQGPNSVAEAR